MEPISKTFFIIVLIIIIIFLRLEKIGVVLRSLNTLIHELSHGFVALILGGRVGKILLNDNASGSCSTTVKGSFKSFLISISGYTLSALFSYSLFLLIDKSFSKYVFYFLLAISIISLIFWIRNNYGIIWTIVFIGINFSIIMIPKFLNSYSNYILLIYGLIICIENLFNTAILIKIAILSPKKAGDATNIAKITKIPSLIWAIGFLSFSLYIAYLSYKEICILLN